MLKVFPDSTSVLCFHVVMVRISTCMLSKSETEQSTVCAFGQVSTNDCPRARTWLWFVYEFMVCVGQRSSSYMAMTFDHIEMIEMYKIVASHISCD